MFNGANLNLNFDVDQEMQKLQLWVIFYSDVT